MSNVNFNKFTFAKRKRLCMLAAGSTYRSSHFDVTDVYDIGPRLSADRKTD